MEASARRPVPDGWRRAVPNLMSGVPLIARDTEAATAEPRPHGRYRLTIGSVDAADETADYRSGVATKFCRWSKSEAWVEKYSRLSRTISSAIACFMIRRPSSSGTSRLK